MSHEEETKRGELRGDIKTRVRTDVENESERFKDLQRDMDKMVELLHDIGTCLLNYQIRKYMKDEGIDENTHLRKAIFLLHEKGKLYDKQTGLLTMAGIHCVAAIINVMPIMMPDKYMKCVCGETHYITKVRGRKRVKCRMFGIYIKAVSWNRLALNFYSEVFRRVLEVYKIEIESTYKQKSLSPIEEKINSKEFERSK